MHLVSRKKIEHPNPKVSCLMQEPGEKGFKKAVDDAFADHGHFDLIIQFAGVLHGEGLKPEKSLRDCSRENLLRSFERNTLPFVFLSKYLRPHLRKSDFTRIVALSARVGSIEDNRKGGWYGYRMSKAALNMAVKNISIEFGNYNCNAAVAALHPGTTPSPLSKPFLSGHPKELTYAPEITAKRLGDLCSGIAETDNGKFFDWDGGTIPW